MSRPDQTYAAKLNQAFSEKFNLKTIIALVIFGMIILTFVFSGMVSGRGGNHLGAGVAATVNGEIISLKQFQDQENRISAYYSQMLGGQFENLIQKKQLQTEALNQLVDNSVAAQSAENEKIFATDSNVRGAIQEMPYFKKEGVFQSDLYKGILAQNGMTPGDFEKSMRQQISIQKVRDLFEASSRVTNLEKNVDDDLKQSKLNLYYLKISPELFTAQMISDGAVNVELVKPDFKIKVTEYIKNHASEFGSAEEVKASHILIKADEKNADQVKKAEATAADVLKQVQAGGDFATLAKKYSDDPGSKEKGGDVGFFTKDRMVPEFSNAAFGLSKGQTSGLVKSSFGFHIIKVTDKKVAVTKNEKEADLIAGRKVLAEQKTLETAKQIEDHIAKNSDQKSAEELLSKMNFKLKETGLFEISTESIPAISAPAAFKAALELTKEKPVAKSLVKDGASQYLIILKEMTKVSNIDAKTKEKRQEMMDKQKSFSQYQYWLDNHKKSFTINRNPEIIAN